MASNTNSSKTVTMFGWIAVVIIVLSVASFVFA
ncbi:hypothetical protein SAMN05428951_107308 [Pseudomonas sp. OV546]|nr:hypothetical protein SAMN05428951_107308 [Pseudomonas sp. OV546]